MGWRTGPFEAALGLIAARPLPAIAERVICLGAGGPYTDFAVQRILPERFCGKCVLSKNKIIEPEDVKNDIKSIREVIFSGGPGVGGLPN